MSDALTRRDFFAWSGATVAGVTLGEWGRRALARADEHYLSQRGPGVERWATSVCRECSAACGVRVRLVDDVPVKLEGNPRCPMARGRLCAKGQAALEGYFDPDRLVGPARRVGPRGDQPRWEPIGWDAALDQLASHLARTLAREPDARGANAPLGVAAEERGPVADAWRRFWTAAGARVVWTPAATAARFRPRLAALTGADREPLFDVERATHILSLGAPLVEDWLSPVWTQRSYGRFRRAAGRPRGRLVHVEARRSPTARKADEWLAVPAEAQVLLAYGIASVILRENRVDRAWLEWAGGNLAEFERAVVEWFAPDEVAAATGVPVVTLLRVARELAASPRPLVTVAADASPALVDACFALDALVGAFDRPGGIMASPAQPAEEPAPAPAALHDVVTGAIQPRVVALRDASALRALTSPADLAGALAKTDLVVSFSPYLDEAAAVADLLLPSPTPLESWHAVVPATAVPAETLACARPAVKTRVGARDPVAVLGTVARRMGGALADACPWASSEALVAGELGRLADVRRGGPYADPYETEWLRDLERGGWWTPAAATRDAFAASVLEAGGWIDPFFEPGAIRDAIRAQGGLRFSLPGVGSLANGRSLTARVQRTPAAGSRAVGRLEAGPDRPALSLRLLPFVPSAVSLVGGSNHPALFELLGQPDGAPWRAWAELNPETARELGVAAGAAIRIISENGASLTVEARLVEHMAADVVAVAYVPGNPRGGRWARLVDADVRRLWDGAGVPSECRVRIARA